ncbi:MFS transporter [Halomonas sp. GXIMD04776]|uniref:MFS transporter n=1 Tax=Halomonas sp. GXIMD04776 TaxID=3415605 RepID=UPI003CACDE57
MGYRTLLRDHRGLLGIGLLAMLSSSLGQSYFVGLFQAPIAERLAISAGEFGVAYSVVTLTAGFVVLYFGPSIDWIAPRRFAMLVLGGMLGGIALLTLSPWALTTLLGLGLVRLCGQGLFTHLGNTLIGREFSHSRGRALGLISLGIPLGEAVLPPLVTVLLVWLGWRDLWWSLGAGMVVVWGLLLWRLDWPAAPGTRPTRAMRRSGPRPLREARFWQLLPLLMALPITMTGLFIYASQLTADLGATMTAYALALTGMGLAKLPGALLGGRWADQLGPGLLARTYLLPYALALILAMSVGGNAGVWALMVGGGLAMGMQEIIATSLLVKLWGSEHLGRVRATLSACMVFSTGIAPAILGVLVDAGIDFRFILAGMLAFILMGWLLAQRPIAEAHASESS